MQFVLIFLITHYFNFTTITKILQDFLKIFFNLWKLDAVEVPVANSL